MIIYKDKWDHVGKCPKRRHKFYKRKTRTQEGFIWIGTRMVTELFIVKNNVVKEVWRAYVGWTRLPFKIKIKDYKELRDFQALYAYEFYVKYLNNGVRWNADKELCRAYFNRAKPWPWEYIIGLDPYKKDSKAITTKVEDRGKMIITTVADFDNEVNRMKLLWEQSSEQADKGHDGIKGLYFHNPPIKNNDGESEENQGNTKAGSEDS